MVFFAIGSSDLSQAAIAILDRQADVLIRYPRIYIDLIGHTDWLVEADSKDGYIALGYKRSLAVRDYLVKKGIAPERISTNTSDYTAVIPNNLTWEDGLARARFVSTETHDDP